MGLDYGGSFDADKDVEIVSNINVCCSGKEVLEMETDETLVFGMVITVAGMVN